jgi:hypothetical protein
LLALLNALGRSPVAFGYALVWAVGTWAIGGPLILLLGPIGYGWANLLIQLTNIALIRQVQAIVPFRLWLAVGPPWLWAGVMGAGVAGVARRWPPEGIVALGLYAGSGLLVYVAGLALLLPEGAQRAWERLRKAAA